MEFSQSTTDDGLPPSNRGAEFSYSLQILEDQDDGRAHDAGWNPDSTSENVSIEERIPIHQISKLFYADSGRLLNIGSEDQDGKSPVLLLKRDVEALPPSLEVSSPPENGPGNSRYERPGILETEVDNAQAEIDQQLLEESIVEQAPSSRVRSNGFPKHLDPEWIAMQMFEEDVDIDGSSTGDDDPSFIEGNCTHSPTSMPAAVNARRSLDSQLTLEAHIKNLSLRSASGEGMVNPISGEETARQPVAENMMARSPFGAITTSLSLIEMLIRLASLQEFQQASHLSIPDHILTFFLEETSTTGLVGEAQWKARAEATRRVGFDPYSDGPKE